MQLNIKSRSKRENIRKKPVAEHQEASELLSKQTAGCSRKGRKTLQSSTQRRCRQYRPIFIPRTLLSLPFFLHPVRRAHPGPEDEAVTTYCQVSLFIVRETSMQGNTSYSQCTSERAAVKGGKQKILPSLLTTTSQAPSFVTHNLC